MLVSIAREGNVVSQHFGHCEGFEVFNIDGSQIKDRKFYPNPGHKPGFLPNYLNDLGVRVIIAGGMGAGAVEIFDDKGIEVITGASGSLEENIKRYIAGELKSSGSVCNHDHVQDDGHEHGSCNK